MKRVVFLAAAAATLVQFTKYDLTALQTLGCEIHMVCNMQEGNISQAALQEYNQMFPQLHWHDLPFSDSAGAVRRNHAAYEKLVPLLKELQPDLLHCRGTIAGWYGRRAAQELQIPVFYTAHDFRIFHGCLLAERLWFSAVERKYRKQTSRFFAVCPEDAAYARKHLNLEQVTELPDVGLDWTITELNARKLMSYTRLLDIQIGWWDWRKYHDPDKASPTDLGVERLEQIIKTEIEWGD